MKVAVYLSLALWLLASCATKPAPAGNTSMPVADSAGVFLPAQLRYLDSMYAAESARTGGMVKLLTIKDYGREKGLSPYARSYFNDVAYAGDTVGSKKILVVFCTNCNGVEIVAGKGTPQQPDEPELKAVIDTVMIPRFSRGQDYDGILNGSRAIFALLGKYSGDVIPGHK